MEIKTTKLVYFSPTGTTEKVLEGISRGFDPKRLDCIDITRLENRKTMLETQSDELVIIGIPVYMGRVPAIIEEWLKGMTLHQTPVACVVVYGNRVYDDALLELCDMVKHAGGIPFAGAAFIGEHSFSSDETPIAKSRPDKDDLDKAEVFGKALKNKIIAVSQPGELSVFNAPGNYPYGGVTKLWDVDFIEISDACTNCGICSKICPVEAIGASNIHKIDIEKCITCCACIKKCPAGARTMKESPVKEAAARLNRLYQDRKAPELFI